MMTEAAGEAVVGLVVVVVVEEVAADTVALKSEVAVAATPPGVEVVHHPQAAVPVMGASQDVTAETAIAPETSMISRNPIQVSCRQHKELLLFGNH